MSEYVPFGDEWKKHVAKLPKRELVEMLAKALNEKQETQLKLYAEQRAAEQKMHPTNGGLRVADNLSNPATIRR